MEYAQAATKTVATIALPTQQQKAGEGRRSGAISKSEAYEPPASAPLLPTTSQQRTKQATDIAKAAHHLNQQRENWLKLGHQALDKAVALAYDWPDYTAKMPDDEILRRLLALNLARSRLCA